MRPSLSILLACASSAAAASVECDSSPGDTTPQGLHLAFAGNASTSMTISFFTCGAPSSGEAPVADVSGSGAPLHFTGTSSATDKRYHHDIVLTGLKPGTAYTYTVRIANGTSSLPHSFTTASATVSKFRMALVGDMGINNTADTLSALDAGKYDFTFHVGDVSYADDAKIPLHIEPSSGSSYDNVYDAFQRGIEPFAARSPYMVLPGNHDVTCVIVSDIGCPDLLKNFSAIRHRWRMPSLESKASSNPQHSSMWYSFRVGAVHFASISTESDFDGAPTTPTTKIGGGAGGGFGDQLGWLKADLAAANADAGVRFIVVLGHRPWYASDGSDWPLGAPKRIQKAFEPLFQQYGVDLYVSGHKHNFERTPPVYAGAVDKSGTTHIINGGAGDNEGLAKGKGVGGLIVAASYETQGFGELVYDDVGSLTWHYLLSANRTQVDSVTMHTRRGAVRR